MGESWVKRIDGKQSNLQQNNRRWVALDPTCSHPTFSDETVETVENQKSQMVQYSEESITVKDSCDVEINSTETQVLVSLQAALQVAIVLVISISIADSSKADQIANDIFQKVSTKQINRQHTFIENSRNVTVTTTDTDLAVNIQLLLQVLVALLIRLDIL